jgi:hypothetical protein
LVMVPLTTDLIDSRLIHSGWLTIVNDLLIIIDDSYSWLINWWWIDKIKARSKAWWMKQHQQQRSLLQCTDSECTALWSKTMQRTIRNGPSEEANTEAADEASD